MKQFGTKGKKQPVTKQNPAPVGKDGDKRYVQVNRAPANFKPKGDAVATTKFGKVEQTRNRVSGARIFVNAGLIFGSIIALTLLIFYTDKLAVDSKYDKLLEEVEKSEQMATAPDQDTVPDPTEPDVTVPDTTEPTDNTGDVTEPTEEAIFDESKILQKYQSLYDKNNELFGWIKIENTNVNYPVMYCAYDNEKYLHADFYGNYLYEGIPYADMKCNRESDNILLYGHNMKNGTMFRDIIKYADKSFWEKHKTIMFSDLTKDYTYEVLAVFYDRIYKKSENVFKFYQFIDAENEEDFNYAISQFKQKSIYDTGVNAQYGDKLITLVTCAYHVENGRFVVVARRK